MLRELLFLVLTHCTNISSAPTMHCGDNREYTQCSLYPLALTFDHLTLVLKSVCIGATCLLLGRLGWAQELVHFNVLPGCFPCEGPQAAIRNAAAGLGPSAVCPSMRTHLYLSLEGRLLEEQNLNISLFLPNTKLRTGYRVDALTYN